MEKVREKEWFTELQAKIIASMIEQGFVVSLYLTDRAIEALRDLGCNVKVLRTTLFGEHECEVWYDVDFDDIRMWGYGE